jgi:hypothetical protein
MSEAASHTAEELKQKLVLVEEPELTPDQLETANAIADELLADTENGVAINRGYFTFHDVQRFARLATQEGMKYMLSRTDEPQGEK